MADRAITKPMTAIQAAAVADIIEHGGEIVRHAGGYWTYPGAVKSAAFSHPFDWWIGTSTVDGLVRRGELVYTEHRDGRNGRFPIRAAICPQKEQVQNEGRS
jgi:hypothetical protein